MSNGKATIDLVEGVGLTEDDVASCPYCVDVMESFEPLVIVEVNGERCLAHSSCHEEAEDGEDDLDDEDEDDDEEEEEDEEAGPVPIE